MQVAWIETFLAIVERGGFCAAADSLFRSQSRVSAHIASLELQLGAELFDRSQRPVALTPAGRAFLNHATAAKASLDAGAAAVRAVEERHARRIALGAYAGTGAALLPSLLTDLAQEHLDLGVEIVEQPAVEHEQALLDGTLDMAIHPRLPASTAPAIRREPLWRERMVVVIPCDHVLAREPEVHLSDLRDEPLITSNEAVTMLRELGFEPNVTIVSDHPFTMVGCVARGLGIGLSSEPALQAVPTDGAVVVELAGPIERVVEACWLGELDAPSEALLEAIRRAGAQSASARPKPAAERVLRLVRPGAEQPAFAEASHSLGVGRR